MALAKDMGQLDPRATDNKDQMTTTIAQVSQGQEPEFQFRGNFTGDASFSCSFNWTSTIKIGMESLWAMK